MVDHFLVRVLLIPSTMLPEVFVFCFSLPILLANETSTIEFEFMSFACGIFCRCRLCGRHHMLMRVAHYRAVMGRGAAAQESASVLRILLYKISGSLLTVISLALGLPRGRRYSFPCAFRLEPVGHKSSQCRSAYTVTSNF